MHGGDDDENQDLIAKLEAEAGAEEQHAFVIGAGEMEAPADLLNATNEALPDSYVIPEGEASPAGDFGHFGNLGGEGEGHVSAAEDPFAPSSNFANDALGADLAAATDAGLAGELGALGDLSDLGDLENLSDVDGMLAAALPEGDLSLGELDLPVPAGEAPTFQVQLEVDDPALKPRLKELAAAHGIQLTTSAWEYATPILSQLTEYQAVLFQREARALGARVKASVTFPVPQPSEDDLALGDLAGIPEPAEVKSEGAPSVVLPKRETEVMLFTGELLPGFLISETKGPVSAHRRIARRMFREAEIQEKMKRELARATGRNAAPADSHLQLLFREVFVDLQKQALKMAANAVLSLRVEFFSETAALDPSSAELRLLVIGTAAVVEKA
jgi:uncharacterized protein YbjQ (UPF0145 family)